jgi:hypothetical protein
MTGRAAPMEAMEQALAQVLAAGGDSR